MSKHIVSCIVISILVCCAVLSFLKPDTSYNNVDSKMELISKDYSDSQTIEMIDKIDGQVYREYEFIRDYDIECLRKTPQGYYAVFRKDDGKFIYVFLYDDFVPVENATVIVDRFKSKEEFLRFVSVERSISDMIEFDSTTVFPFSGRNSSIHHVVEGVFLVDYFNDVVPWNTATVAHIDFFEDSELLQMKDGLNIPYILSIDRRN